jgi:hypothetical protein
MFKKLFLLGVVLIFIISCGGGGGGDGGDGGEAVFKITDHLFFRIDLDCSEGCPDLQCIMDNCVELINDDGFCVDDDILFYLEIRNDEKNTTEICYRILINGGVDGVEGPFCNIINWFEPEEINSTIAGIYEGVLDVGNHVVEAWLKNADGKDSEVYVIDIVVSECPAAGLQKDPLHADGENVDWVDKEEFRLRNRLHSMGWDGWIE